MSEVIFKESADVDCTLVRLLNAQFLPGVPVVCNRNPVKNIFFGFRSGNTLTDALWDQAIDFDPQNMSVANNVKYAAQNKTFPQETKLPGLNLTFGLHGTTRDFGLAGPTDNSRRLSCFGGNTGNFWQGGKLTFTCLTRMVGWRYGSRFSKLAGAYAMHGFLNFSMNL